MSAASRREHDSLAPAFLAAVALHAGLLALVILFPSRPSVIPIGSSVPINIVSSDKFTDSRPAEVAPQTQTAATETPTPQAPPAPPVVEKAPPSPPTPAPARPAPTPKPPKAQAVPAKRTPTPPPPVPVAHPVKPAPAPAHTAPARPTLNLDALQAAIDKAAHAQAQHASSAPKGPSRAETAPQARPNAGQGVSQSDLLGLQQLLERLWNPNCGVPGGDAVRLRVSFTVGYNGEVFGPVQAGGQENSDDAVVNAAAHRAIDAVRQAEPYTEAYYGQKLVVNFDAKEACARQ